VHVDPAMLTMPLPRVAPPPPAGEPAEPSGRDGGDRPAEDRRQRRRSWRRARYAALVALGTAGAVLATFSIFSADRPEPPPVAAGATPAASPSPSPTGAQIPAVPLPKLPENTPLPVRPGPGTPVVETIEDRKAGIGYARFGEPWRSAWPKAFTCTQMAGPVRRPFALIGSRPLPGPAPGRLTTPQAYQAMALRAVRWTLRYQPQGARVTWTASQPVPQGTGWLLGYRVSYRVDGETRSSEAIVAVVGTGRARPALLFATVPDDRPELYRDLNTLISTLRPL